MSTHGNRPSDRIGMNFRHKEGVNQGGIDEVNEQDVWLAPLRSPANIRDMKQIFFYVSRTSSQSGLGAPELPGINPLVVQPSLPFGNTPPGDPPTSNVPWQTDGNNKIGVEERLYPNHDSYVDRGTGGPPYTLLYNTYPAKNYRIQNPLGTEVPLDIVNMIRDNYDIRVSPDKYVIEISLVECQIDSSPGNYLGTFKQNQKKLIIPNGEEWNSSDIKLNSVVPQGLFCRIKEVDNGEPYNWVVTNTGSYSNDRSHAVLLRFGDLSYSQLTLEYGHLSLEGFKALPETIKSGNYEPGNGGPQNTPDPNKYNFPPSDAQIVTYPVPEQGAIVDGVNQQSLIGDESWNVVYPQKFQKNQGRYYDYNRAWYMGPQDPDQPKQYNGQVIREDEPLFYNQQATNIQWRFMIKMIHLF